VTNGSLDVIHAQTERYVTNARKDFTDLSMQPNALLLLNIVLLILLAIDRQLDFLDVSLAKLGFSLRKINVLSAHRSTLTVLPAKMEICVPHVETE